MAHYAILDANNVVINVITGVDEGTDGIDWEEFYGAKRTSYNTYGGVYYVKAGEPAEDQSKAFRKNYACIGGTYDPVRDAFLYPKPDGPDWVLNEDTCLWEGPPDPVELPPPAPPYEYTWDEETQSWV